MKPSLPPLGSSLIGRWQAAIAAWADSPWFFPIVLVTTVTVLFFDCVGQDCVFAFRDSLHFYPPLYRLVANEWLAGRVPLWNPLLNCGQPLAGMGTAGAFYPPQLLLTMLLPDGVSLNVYCILHLAFAATGAYFVARYQGCSRPAATVAGLAYAFSGSVLLQIYNPIFAAGAAWLVWAVLGGVRLLDGGDVCDFLLLAASLALSVFAGDPQSAYHAGLVLGVYWLMQPARSWWKVGLLAACGAAGGLLCLVQVALAAEFARESTRAVDLVPFSLWDVPQFLARPAAVREGVEWYDVLIGRPPAGADHYHAMYCFPVEAYRLGELLWPGLSGTALTRWPVQAGFGRVDCWAGSLYCGMFPVLAAIAAGMMRSISRQNRFWVALAVLTLLASCGQIGAGAFVRWGRELFSGHGLTTAYQAGDEVGGLYWLMASVLPGYAGFRYPAKWMTVAMLAVAQLSARTVDGLGAKPLRTRLLSLAIAAAVIDLCLVLTAAVAASWGGSRAVLPWYTDAEVANDVLKRLLEGGIQGAIAAVITCACACAWRQGCPARIAVAALVATDLALAGRPEIRVVPWSRVVEASSYLAGARMGRLPNVAACGHRVRIRPQSPRGGFPAFSDEQRESLPLPVDTWCTAVSATGHLSWLHGCELIGDPGTAMYLDMDALRASRHRGEHATVPRRFLDNAGTEFFLVVNHHDDPDRVPSILDTWSPAQLAGRFEGEEPRGEPMPLLGVPIGPPSGMDPILYVCRNQSALPRARIVRNIATIPPVVPAERDRWLGLLERVAFPTPDMPDLRRAAIVEVAQDDGPPFPAGGSGSDEPAVDACHVVVDESQRVVLQVELSMPGMLYLADTFHRDWTATVTAAGSPPRAAPILRTNRVHRGVGLAAGRHLVEFRYASRTFGRTAPITAAAWCIAAVTLGGALWRRSWACPKEQAA